MNNQKKDSNHNDDLQFAKESETDLSKAAPPHHQIKLLIVDDDKEIHTMTKLVLSDFTKNAINAFKKK